MVRKTTMIGAGMLVLIASSVIAIAAYVGASERGQAWQSIAWPFPRDGWPPGHAYRCQAATCGSEMELYVRPKIGFCNCDTGVADDDEVDRVADLDMITPRFRPLQPGQVVQIAGMTGRTRNYSLNMSDGSTRQAVGMAVSHRCDLMVAVVQGKASTADLQQRALALLSSHDEAGWIKSAMQSE
ncbi:hypothetical protein [Bradyrhizobium sp. SYSU BS000235]|uniref:hypothetical protein n=1 Tax=Bradyrhizobium sp. SYSU BS000235 TaxID=3411332 RepID=UPI003C72881C